MTKRYNVLLSILIIMAVVLLVGTAASYAATVNNGTARVNTPDDTALLRAKANTSSEVVAELKDNTKLTVKKIVFKSKTSTAKTNKWYCVTANGKTGYIRSDLVDNQKYTGVDAKVTKAVTYRKGAGTQMAKAGTLKKNAKVKVLLKATPVSSTKGSSSTWYMIKYNKKTYYACSSYFKITGSATPTPTPEPEAKPISDDEFKADLEKQGFDSTYVDKLMELHKAHPSWKFEINNTGVNWDTAVKAENTGKISLIQRNGGSTWVTANKEEVSFYLDPRNFLNNERVFMFEDLNYRSGYQTEAVVAKILKGTKLEEYGFDAKWFVKYGAMYNVSPVHLASRAKKETGGGSAAINGHGEINDQVCYNPFNIGANSGVYDGLEKAYEEEWFTQEESIKGGAEFIADGYINAGQNTVYSQKFNIVNGKANHQYMQNIKAPYEESYITYQSYVANGILDEPFVFIIPVYDSMPESTSLE